MVYLLCSGDIGIVCHVVIGHFSTSGDKLATSPRPASNGYYRDDLAA